MACVTSKKSGNNKCKREVDAKVRFDQAIFTYRLVSFVKFMKESIFRTSTSNQNQRVETQRFSFILALKLPRKPQKYKMVGTFCYQTSDQFLQTIYLQEMSDLTRTYVRFIESSASLMIGQQPSCILNLKQQFLVSTFTR